MVTAGFALDGAHVTGSRSLDALQDFLPSPNLFAGFSTQDCKDAIDFRVINGIVAGC